MLDEVIEREGRRAERGDLGTERRSLDDDFCARLRQGVATDGSTQVGEELADDPVAEPPGDDHLLRVVEVDEIGQRQTEVIDELVDYTLSHFAFEEELMEEAGYPFCAAHKRVHEVFGKRVMEYRLRFAAGEDIADELRAMLARWLFNHIRGDDQAYAETVKRHLNRFTKEHEEGRWLSRTLRRLFG